MKSKVFLVDKGNKNKIKYLDIPKIDKYSVLIKILSVPLVSKVLFKSQLVEIDYPYIPGSEAIAKVIEIGSEACKEHKIEKGDLIFVEPFILCKKCAYCLKGDYNFCESKRHYGHLSSQDYPFLLGSFAQYMILLPGSRVHKLKEEIPLENYALTGLFATAIRCITNKGDGYIGKSLLILGLNIFSLACALVAKTSGLDPILILDKEITNSEKEIVAGCGIDIASNIKGNQQFDLLVKACNYNDLEVESKTIFNCIKPKGKYIIPFEYSDKENYFQESLLAQKEIEIIGSFYYSWELKKALNLINKHSFHLENIPNESYCLEDVEKAYEIAKIKKMTNIIIKPNLI